MFKRKKPSSATTSTNSVASPSSAATSAVSKKQQFNNVPEPKKKFPPREFRKKKITKCLFQKNQSVAHPQIHYYETHDSAFCHVCVQHTTEVASATTILSHNRLLKDIATRKMRLIREEVSRVTNCQRVTKKPSSAISFSQRAQKMQVKHCQANSLQKNLLIAKLY